MAIEAFATRDLQWIKDLYPTDPMRVFASAVRGMIVPDLPHEEAGDLHAALETEGLALIQMVTPVTPPERLARLCAAAEGFVYAVMAAFYSYKRWDVDKLSDEEVRMYLEQLPQIRFLRDFAAVRAALSSSSSP